MEFWTLPGPEHYVEELHDALVEGRSTVLVQPAHMPAGLAEVLRSKLGQCWNWVRLVAGDRDPVSQVVDEVIGVHRIEGAVDPRLLTSSDSFQGYVIWVDGCDSISWPRWRRFLAEYEHASRSVPAGARSVFCVVLPATMAKQAPSEDVALAVRPWHGRVSEIDMLLYAAVRLYDGVLSPQKRSLLAACVARVALWDPNTVDRLCQERPEGMLEPVEVLRTIAAERNWGAGMAAHWAHGSEEEVDGMVQTHSAILALNDPGGALRRRLWGAQAGVILPLIEERRQDLLPKIRNYLRLPLTTVFGEIKLAEELEIGQIAFQLHRHCPHLQLRNTADRLRDARNALAHLDPLDAGAALHADLYR